MKTAGSIINQTNTDDLSERVTFQYATFTQDEEGNITRTYTDRVEMFAKVLPISSQIVTAQGETQNRVTYRIVVRYNSDILPSDRVIWRDRVLVLTNVPYDAESRHIWTVCECRELIEDG